MGERSKVCTASSKVRRRSYQPAVSKPSHAAAPKFRMTCFYWAWGGVSKTNPARARVISLHPVRWYTVAPLRTNAHGSMLNMASSYLVSFQQEFNTSRIRTLRHSALVCIHPVASCIFPSACHLPASSSSPRTVRSSLGRTCTSAYYLILPRVQIIGRVTSPSCANHRRTRVLHAYCRRCGQHAHVHDVRAVFTAFWHRGVGLVG